MLRGALEGDLCYYQHRPWMHPHHPWGLGDTRPDAPPADGGGRELVHTRPRGLEVTREVEAARALEVAREVEALPSKQGTASEV